jgi:membrane-associated phospholipid phosphatase
MMLLAIVLAALFAALTAAVVAPDSALRRLDDRAMAAVARRRTERIDGVLGPLATLATREPLVVQSLVAFVMLAVTIGRAAALHFAVAAIGSGILSEGVKRAVNRARPKGPHLIRWIRGFSYPSGDLLTAAAIYLTIALIASPRLPDDTARAALFTIVVLVLGLLAVCRFYVGVHHPSDVAGGVCLGAAWALFVAAWLA